MSASEANMILHPHRLPEEQEESSADLQGKVAIACLACIWHLDQSALLLPDIFNLV